MLFSGTALLGDVIEPLVPEVWTELRAWLALELHKWFHCFVVQLERRQRVVQASQFGKIDQDFQDTVNLTPDSKWVPRAGEPLANRVEAGDRIQLVGQ